MRRLLTACAVTTLSLAALGLATEGPAVLASAPPEIWQSAVAIIAPKANARPAVPANAIVVAQGIVARSVAHDGKTNLYITTPAAPNRVLALPVLRNHPDTAETDAFAGAGSLPSAGSSVSQAVPFAGGGQKGSLGDSGTALMAQFDLKTDSILMRSGIAVAPDGTTFIADTLNRTIRRISGPNGSPDGIQPGMVSSIAGRWASGENTLLIEPVGIALDRAGNLYIADHAAGAVYLVRAATSASPGAIEIFAHVVSPGSVATAPDGSRVFVSSPDTGKLFGVATKTRAVNAISGFESTASLSTPAQSSQAGGSYCGVTAETAPEACPSGLASDGEGNLFIADATLGEIFRADAKTGASSLAASGLTAPGDLAFDVSGNLFVADQGNGRILEFKGMGAPLSTLTIAAPAPLPPPIAPEICNPLETEPDAYNFCNEPVNGSTAAQAFTLTNNSAATVSSLSWSVTPAMTPSNFSIPGTTCTASLAPGASCTINVAFTPPQSGEQDSALTVSDLAGDMTSSELGGTGTDFQLALANGQTTLLNVEQGQGVTFMLQLIPDANFAGNVTFVCPPAAINLATSNGFVPPYTSCTITPASTPVSPGTPVPFSVRFQTTYNFIPPVVTAARVGAPVDHPRRPGGTASRAIALAIAALLAVLALARRKEVFYRNGIWLGLTEQLPAISLGTVLMALALLGACHKYKLNPAAQTTPAGIATMTLTATSQGVSRGVTFTLEVVPFVPTLPGDRTSVSGASH